MPLHRRAVFGLMALLLAVLPVRAGEPDDPLAEFDEYATAALADLKTPGMAIAIVKNGEIVLARGYGVRRVGGHDPVDERTIFPIASVTKVFTATCLAQLVEEGRLAWDDPVVKHLPEFTLHDPYLTKDVRIADLLSHRTGLETADLLAYRGDYDRAEILRRLRFVQPIAPLRSRYSYNNLMVVTAGEVLARVAHEPWAMFLGKRLLEPLGMSATQTSPPGFEGRDNVSTPHVLTDGRVMPDPMWNRDASEGFRRLHEAVAPAGAIQSNVMDMTRFLQLYLNEGVFDDQRLLKKETIREMFAPHSVLPTKPSPNVNFAYPRFFFGCGYGWQLRDYRGRKIVFHGGSSGAVVAMMPEENIGMVVLANRGSGVVYMVMHDVFDRLLGIPRTWTNHDWVVEAEEQPQADLKAKNANLEAKRAKDTKASLPLTEYAGTYECDLYGKLEIREEGGSLRLQFGSNITATLRHWEHDTFRCRLSFPPDDEWFVRFVVADGKPSRLEVERIFWHEAMPTFRRVRPPEAHGR